MTSEQDIEQWGLAIQAYTQAISTNPNNVTSLLDRGLPTMTKIEKLIKRYTEEIKEDPNNLFAYINLAGIYLRQRKYQLALKYYNELIRIKPDFFHGFILRGLAYLNHRQDDKAIEDFTKAMRLDTEDTCADVYLYRGNVYALKGEYERAIQDYDKAWDIKPFYTEAKINREKAITKLRKLTHQYKRNSNHKE